MREFHCANSVGPAPRMVPRPGGHARPRKARAFATAADPSLQSRSSRDAVERAGAGLPAPGGRATFGSRTLAAGDGRIDFTNPASRTGTPRSLDRCSHGLDASVGLRRAHPGHYVEYFDARTLADAQLLQATCTNPRLSRVAPQRRGDGRLLFARSSTAGSSASRALVLATATRRSSDGADLPRAVVSPVRVRLLEATTSRLDGRRRLPWNKRGSRFVLLSPSHSRLHGTAPTGCRACFDEEAVDVLRTFTRLKCCGCRTCWRPPARDGGRDPRIRVDGAAFPYDPGCTPCTASTCSVNDLLVRRC